MKHLKLIIVCLCLAANCFAEGFTVQELQKILTAGDWNTANQMLAKKNWYFNKREEIEDSDTHEYEITWGLDNSGYSQYADSWLIAYVDNYGNGEITSVNYQMFRLEDYSKFMSSISSAGYKFIKNSNEVYNGEDRMKSIYQNSQYLLTITIIKQEKGYDTYTAWMVDLDFLGGRYDPYNGKKCSYYEDSRTVEYECTIKEGIIVGDYKAYYDNGILHYIIRLQKNQWIITEYDRKGKVLGNLTVPIKNREELKSGCHYDLKATGYYKFPLHYFPTIFGWYDYKGKYSYEIEGNMNIRVFSNTSINNCPFIMFRVECDKGADQYKYTEYEYSNNDSLLTKTISNKNNKETHYIVYDSNNLLIEQGQHRDSVLYGELQEYEYIDDGKLYIEKHTNYNDKGELHGTQTITTYLTDGTKLVTINSFKDEELDGLCEQAVYIKDKKYIKSYFHYDMGVLSGNFIYSSNDTVAMGTYRNHELYGSQKIYHDGLMRYRHPAYPIIDTTQLTLICDSYYEDNKVMGEEKYYYPCYYTDTIKMIKGEHSGELYLIKNYDTYEKTTLSDFDITDPSTYRKFKRVEQFNSNWWCSMNRIDFNDIPPYSELTSCKFNVMVNLLQNNYN